jgi:hypothetical protein
MIVRVVLAVAQLPVRLASMGEYSVLEASRPAAIRERSQSGVERTLLPTAGAARFLAHDLDRFDRLQMRKLPVRNFLHERQRR